MLAVLTLETVPKAIYVVHSSAHHRHSLICIDKLACLSAGDMHAVSFYIRKCFLTLLHLPSILL